MKKQINQRLKRGMLGLSIFFLTAPQYVDAKGKTNAKPTSAPASTSAGSLSTSKAVTGTKALFTDASSALLVVSPVIAAAILTYLYIKLQTASEEEAPRLKKRQKRTVFAAIAAMIASGMLKIILAYYK